MNVPSASASANVLRTRDKITNDLDANTPRSGTLNEIDGAKETFLSVPPWIGSPLN